MKANNPFVEETEQYVQQIKSGLNSILVTVRVRPLNAKQKLVSNYQTIKVLQQKLLILTEPETAGTIDILRKNRNKDNQFAFDYVFDQFATTEYIYENAIGMLLDGIFQGYNATVLAYGATSCGKTYTMIGEGQNPGVMALTVLDILSRAQQLRKQKNIIFKVSYIQIYNETIKDLLISEDKNFDLREDPKEGITIAGVTQVVINNLNELKTILRVGAKNRTKQSTGSNQFSSRSHAILQIQTQTKEKAQSTVDQTIFSKLSLVDLAGSERASNTTNRGQRMVEGAKINQSLLTLGNCIQSLSEASEKGLKNVFVPYRGSKLTRLLKDSLGGNCRTVMISHVTPAVSSFQQTYNTIIYANRAKSIKNNATRNILQAQTHISNYVNVINVLKKENLQLKQQINNQRQLRQMSCLPSVQNPVNYEQQVQKYEINVKHLMKQQQAIVHRIAELGGQIQIIAFQIFIEELQKDEENVKKKVKSAAELTKQKLVLEKKVSDLKVLLQKLENQVVKNDSLGKTGQAQILNLIKQKKIAIQSEAIKLKQTALEHEKQLIAKFIKKVKKDLKVRDKIIESQKMLIKKNNIISRITYSQLNYSLDTTKEDQEHSKHTRRQQSSSKNTVSNKYSIKTKLQNKIVNNDKKPSPSNIDRNKSVQLYSQKAQGHSPILSKKGKIGKIGKISDDCTQSEGETCTINRSKQKNQYRLNPSNKLSIPAQSPRDSPSKKMEIPAQFSRDNSSKKVGIPAQQKVNKKPGSNKDRFDFVYLPH